MNDKESVLLSVSEPSIKGKPEAALDLKTAKPPSMVENSPGERINEASDNFESLTFVSSQGFFFQ